MLEPATFSEFQFEVHGAKQQHAGHKHLVAGETPLHKVVITFCG